MESFLTTKLGRLALTAVIIAALMVSCGVQTARLKHAKADLTEARAALYVPGTKITWKATAQGALANYATCQGDRSNLTTQLGKQNAALAELGAESDRKLKANTQALQAARKQAAAAHAAADRILNIRAEGSDTCARMLDAERQITEIAP